MIAKLKSLFVPFAAKGDSGETPSGIPRDAGVVTGFFYGAVLVGLGLLVLYAGDVKSSVVVVLWACACLSAGTFVGFLFGVPRIQQTENGRTSSEKSTAESTATYQQRVNTNLTEISDWLTKIIVGLGLINLTKLPPLLRQAAQFLAQGIPGATDPTTKEPLALALIVFFSVMGFLFGYLSTRLFLAPAFSRADQRAAETQRKQQQQIDSTTAQLAAVTTAVRVLGSPGAEPDSDDKVDGTKQAQPPVSIQPVKSDLKGDETNVTIGQKKLLELANVYTGIQSPDYMERVQRKDKTADDMAALALRARISKDWITQQAEASGSDGLIVALASIISVAPDPSDLDRLLRVAEKASWKHTRFRVAVAISSLFSQNLASPAFIEPVLKLLAIYKRGADEPLLRMISQTLATISRATGRSVALT